MLNKGDKLPEFALRQTDGTVVNSASFAGKTVVLYFYPKDDTPGCTKEACSLRDSFTRFEQQGTLVYGISPDGVDSHQKFATKYQLPFPLFSDPDHAVALKFGVWVEKTAYGKKSMGIARTTFVIGADGTVADVIAKVNTESHAEQLLDIL
jgi:peroxiredoxin Q/BCP